MQRNLAVLRDVPSRSPKPLRIGVLSDELFPCNETDTHQIVKNAGALARVGFSVDLVIPYRSGRVTWPRQRRIQEISSFYGLEEKLGVVQLLTLPAGRLRPPVKLTHGLAGPAHLRSHGYDIAYTRNLLPAVVSLAAGLRVVFDTYRAFGDEYPKLTAVASHIARHAGFLGFLSHSQYAARSLVVAGMPPDRIQVMHNGYDPKDMEPVLGRAQARKLIGVSPARNLAVYTGNLQKNKGVESILSMAARLPDALFLIVGGTPRHVSRLKAHADRLGASNIEFTGHKPVGEVARYLYAADVLVVPPTSEPLTTYGRTVLPMKLYTYLAAGRAILAPDLPDNRELLEHGENAWLVRPDDPGLAVRALKKLMSDKPLRRRLAKAAGNTGKDLTWDARARRIRAWLLDRCDEMNCS